MQQYQELSQLVERAGDDVVKAAEGNKAAGTRVRKAMQDIKNKAQEIRQALLAVRSGPKS